MIGPMTPPRPSYYVTTPIYYVNDRPHIGHCFSTIVADVQARFERLFRGVPAPARSGPDAPAGEVFFLTGTDEHADKVVTSAAGHGTTPQAWADQNAAAFVAAFAQMGISNDDFIRTTESRHKERVASYIKKMLTSGVVYRGDYTGWYDEGQEEYLTETAAKEAEYKSPINGKPLVKRTEPCYFFQLSKFGEPLQRHLSEHPEFVKPDSRRNEVLGRLKLGLNDVPISRPVTNDPATQWGVRMPDDPAHRVYVWIDALFNYLTAVDTPQRRHLWPKKGQGASDRPVAIQLIGKDILWFHAVIWPALLMSIGEEVPTTIYGHGWWLSEGQKMSKTLGNFVDLEQLAAYSNKFSLDALRWYLVTQGPIGGNDANFAHAKFVDVFNSDLANGIGNCTSRVANMIAKYFDGKAPISAKDAAAAGPKLDAYPWPTILSTAVATTIAASRDFDPQKALAQGVELVRKVDGYINVTEPFRLAKLAATDPAKKRDLAAILVNCAEALRIAALILSPAMPSKMAQVLADWSSTPPAGVTFEELARLDGPHSLKEGTPIKKGEILFQRADPAEGPPARVATG
jgi:methionyl-tRNA synthetase